MNAEQAERAIECLGRTLTDIGWKPEIAQTGVFHIDFEPPYVPISTGLAAIIRETGQFVLYLNFGFLISPERRDEVLKFITRANWDLVIGNFELDLDDGHLRVKSSLDFEGAELTERLVRNAVAGAMTAVEAHAPALMKIVSS